METSSDRFFSLLIFRNTTGAQADSPTVTRVTVKANEELLALGARHLKCRKSAVSIKSGASARTKLSKSKTAEPSASGPFQRALNGFLQAHSTFQGGGSVVASNPKLIIRDIRARAVFVPLGRPVATRVGEFAEWPLIPIDLFTEQGITGRGYLAPYIKQSAAYIIPALNDIAKLMKGQEVAPIQTHKKARASLGLVGYQGISTIAVAGFDMACWDALAKSAGISLATLLGGTIGPVKAYNSNGLGLMPPDRVADEALELLAEGGFKGLKVRVGRDSLADDLAAVRNVRRAVGEEVMLVCDFNRGLTLGEAMRRCHALDAEDVYLDRGTDRL